MKQQQNFNHDDYPNDYLVGILKAVKTIAMVGASDDPLRPSHGVMHFLQRKGYRVIPVNPKLEGRELNGERAYARLADVPDSIDMVDVFRRVEDLPQVFDEAIAVSPKVIWTQLGLRHDQAAAKAEAAGIKVVMGRCPAIEIPRLRL